MNKILTDSADQARDSEDHILASKDYELRAKAVKDNQDIVAMHFVERMEKLIKYVFPILQIKDYILRYEVQHREPIQQKRPPLLHDLVTGAVWQHFPLFDLTLMRA